VQRAVDLIDEAACRALKINRTDARCLDIVDGAGQVSAGRIAQEAGLTTPAVTIEQLELLRDSHRRGREFIEERAAVVRAMHFDEA